MPLVRLIADPKLENEQAAVLKFRAWFNDPEATSLVLHKTGAIYDGPGGEQYLVGVDGVPRRIGAVGAVVHQTC
jgi:hypothetical protein